MAEARERRAAAGGIAVMGIDPGTLATGYGIVLRSRTGALSLATCGVIRNASAVSMQDRLKTIADGLRDVIEEWTPDELAIESSFYGRNAQSALKLGQARGACLEAAADFHLSASESSPREVKLSVTGTGSAGKRQVQYMVRTLLRLDHQKMAMDTSDAIAIALCHLNRRAPRSSGPKSWKAFVERHPERVIG